MQIDTNVKMPASTAGRPMKYPWRDMAVGNSVFFDDEPMASQSKPAVAGAVWGRNNNAKFSSRTEGNGVRIWRVA